MARKIAEAYLNYLYTPEAQEIIAASGEQRNETTAAMSSGSTSRCRSMGSKLPWTRPRSSGWWPAGSPSSPAPPAGSGAPPPPAASAAPLPAGDVTITAQGIAYVETTFSAPASKAFTIVFDNEDPSTPHDIVISDASGAVVFQGKQINGISNIVYDVPALPAGTYQYICSIHPIPAMTRTATIK